MAVYVSNTDFNCDPWPGAVNVTTVLAQLI